MNRIQHPSATSTHQFTEGDPGSGVPATTVTATWLNGLQEELVHLLEVAGITPDAGSLTQVKAALDLLYSGAGDLTALTAALAAETSARQAADASLVSGLASVNSRVTAEETARAGADASLLSAMQAADNNLQGQIAAEVVARQNADVAEVAARTAADSALSTSLALQQALVRTFSNLMEFFPLATPTLLGSIIGQNRLTRTRRADGKTLYGVLEFQWSSTFADSGSCGWALGSANGYLAAEIDSALRELWGIGPSDEWLHPYIFGDIYVGGNRYTLSIYNQPAGPKFTISGGVNVSNTYAFGRVSLYIPGEYL